MKQDSVAKGGGQVNESNDNISKTVLWGPSETGTSNLFAGYAVQSNMALSTNNGSNALYTDTDPDLRSEIITVIKIKKPGTAGHLLIEVKLNIGNEANCVPTKHHISQGKLLLLLIVIAKKQAKLTLISDD